MKCDFCGKPIGYAKGQSPNMAVIEQGWTSAAGFERTTVSPYDPCYAHIMCFRLALQSRSGVIIDVKGGVATVRANPGQVPVKIVDRDSP